MMIYPGFQGIAGNFSWTYWERGILDIFFNDMIINKFEGWFILTKLTKKKLTKKFTLPRAEYLQHDGLVQGVPRADHGPGQVLARHHPGQHDLIIVRARAAWKYYF